MERTWSEELINTTREIAGTGCILQSIDGKSGIYVSAGNGSIEIHGIDGSGFMPLPTEEVIATFSNLEAKAPVSQRWDFKNFQWAEPVGTIEFIDDFLDFRKAKMNELFGEEIL